MRCEVVDCNQIADYRGPVAGIFEYHGPLDNIIIEHFFIY